MRGTEARKAHWSGKWFELFANEDAVAVLPGLILQWQCDEVAEVGGATPLSLEKYCLGSDIRSSYRARQARRTNGEPVRTAMLALREFCGDRSCLVVLRGANCNGRSLASC
jgi:hypothetical protein